LQDPVCFVEPPADNSQKLPLGLDVIESEGQVPASKRRWPVSWRRRECGVNGAFACNKFKGGFDFFPNIAR
jgi:hypothetical protein